MGPAGPSVVADNVFEVFGHLDATKIVEFDLSGSAPATTTILHTTSTVSRMVTIPDATDTLVARDTVDTLTHKTLTTPTISGGTATGLTNFSLSCTGGTLIVRDTETLTGNRNFSIKLHDVDRIFDLAGDITFAAAFTTAGAFPITLTATAPTALTLPTSGTLASTASPAFTGNVGFSEGSLAATGTTQATAAPIVTDRVQVTTSSGNTGVILPSVGGDLVIVDGSTASGTFFLQVYPPVGQKISILATNAPDGPGTNVVGYVRVSSTQWRKITSMS